MKMSIKASSISAQVKTAMGEFLSEAELKAGNLVVLGCSTSEIHGSRIGLASTPETGLAVIKAVMEMLEPCGLHLAVQCCEHLNRALVVEEEVMEKFCLEQVLVMPTCKAGGSAATAAYQLFKRPVVVEQIIAQAGLDIGDTEIGMHIAPVQVPLRLPSKRIGEAALTCLKRRPKLIGGPRAQYSS